MTSDALLAAAGPAGAVFVPHVHWDREWYEPFQVFRHRLVAEFDRLLDVAESDPSFRFTLDGQTAAIQDYLEMRPDEVDRVSRLVAEKRLALGPWLILLDEFLCTGETIVRNLRFGVEGAAALGGAMSVGYLPDMFGHIAQMPQILVRAGIGRAVLWRGVPAAIDGHEFVWQAPDGSRVRTEYLFDGYDNGLDILLVPEMIGRALDDYTVMTKQRWGGDPVLAMAGTDHAVPDARLVEWLRRAARPDRPIAVATLPEYLEGLPTDVDLPTVVGELRSHARGNVLPGVLSVRRSLKQGMAEAERVVDEAERLAARWSRTSQDEFLNVSWRKIIESSAHDSVVGSGSDETSDQVAARLAEAGQIARAVRDGVLSEVAATVPSSAFFVANPLTSDRIVVASVDVETTSAEVALMAVGADGRRLPLQILGAAATVLADENMAGADLERVLRRIHRRELFGRQINDYTVTPGLLVFRVAESASEAPFDLLELRGAVASAVADHPGNWRVVTEVSPVRSVLVEVPVAASGTTAFTIREAESPVSAAGTDAPDSISNGLVSVRVRPDGTFDLYDDEGLVLAGLGRLVDGGDRGDSYNYAPPDRETLIDTPSRVSAEVVEEGPVRWKLQATRVYEIPVGLSDDPDRRSLETTAMTVETVAELRSNEPFVRLSLSFENPARDHRMRIHFPLPEAAACSESEGQFAVTRRGLVAEAGWGEFPLPTFPATSFVAAGAATILLDHATEYEVVDDGRELALTVLRAIGSISVNLHPLRDEPAAAEIPVPGAQAFGETITARLAVLPARAGWERADAVRHSAHFRSEPLVRRGAAPLGMPMPGPAGGLKVTGGSAAVTAVHHCHDGIEVRVVGMSDSPVAATITGDFRSATDLSLLGDPIETEECPGTLHVRLQPWEIRSLLLR
ncbi:alpha-mannosidase [Cryptosporangium sp. NPDC048952]|uniref:glycoside hydrolase family 38 N-terminal domain-containing protein n=1 Tax=Cryptosporangium sp. NPDC048952 TaxID=3363961 RepID=UPI003719E340